MQLKKTVLATLTYISLLNLTPAIAAPKYTEEATGLITGITTLNNSEQGKKILTQNLAKSLEINKNSTKAEQQQALYDNTLIGLIGSIDNGLIVADALGGKMKEVFFENTSIKIDPTTYQNVGKSFSPSFKSLFTQVNSIVSSDNDFAKHFFATGEIEGKPYLNLALPEGGIFGVYDEAYKDQIANGGHPNGVGNARPAQVSPDSIVIFEGTDFFGKPASSDKDALATIQDSPAYPSGHSALGFSSTLLFAQMVPEQYQEFMARGSEFGNSRAVLGVHYTLDIMGARIMTTYAVAQMLNNNPDYTNQEIKGMLGNSITTTGNFQTLLADAQKDLRSMLEQGCQMSIADCKKTAPKKSKEERAKERQDYLDRLTYGLDPIGDTTLEAVVPEGAEVLIATRYPYLDKAQRREILRTTMIESGHALDDGSGWARLNLYDAAGGYGSLESDVVVNMDASQGGLNAYDEWNNDIKGTGSLEKKGTGVLELSGDSSYTGLTTVSGGALIVSGSLASDVLVKPLAIFQGSGMVGSVTVEKEAIIANSSEGALTVNGDLSLNGATYLVTVNAPENSRGKSTEDRTVTNSQGIIVKGNVLLQDATLSVVASQDQIGTLMGQKQQILTANNITGDFTIENQYLLVDSLIEKSNSGLDLTLTRNQNALGNYALNQNGQAVATALESMPLDSPLYNHFLASTNAATVGQELGQLSGQVYADIVSSTMEESHLLRDQLQLRLNDRIDEVRNEKLTNLWGSAYGNWGKVKDRDNLVGFKRDTQGLLIGLDTGMQNNMILGFAAGYSKSKMKWDHRPNVDQDNYQLAVYGATNWDRWKLSGGLSYAWHRADVDRAVTLGTLSEQHSDKFKLETMQIFADLGYQIPVASSSTLEPFVNLAYVNVKNKDLTESGITGLDVKSKNHHYFASTLGLRLNSHIGGDNSALQFAGTLGWRQQFGNLDREVDLRFQNSAASFKTMSVPASRSGAVIQAALSYQMNQRSEISFGYQGLISKNAHDHSVNLGINIDL
ncbi:hypothetical protein GCM10007162_06330 [Ignatzschineria ureiclastica]|nr:autotransporter domain-containing protein [Ignatzschineria ureiclastica]GGZ93626.1 hypothetical protein GCM10007162_06330 [Ignatzschineria ureiclastica]